MEDAKGDLGGLVRGQAEQRAAQGDASYVGELGMQLADLRGRCRTGAGVRAPAGPRGAGTRPHSRPRQPRTAAPTPRRKAPIHCGLRPPAALRRLSARGAPAGHRSGSHHRLRWTRVGAAGRAARLPLPGVGAPWRGYRHVPRAAFLAARTTWRHPLSWLPVHRRDFEANADFPSRSIRGSASGVPSRLPEEGRISSLNYRAGSELSRQSWVAGPAHGWAGNSPCPAGA